MNKKTEPIDKGLCDLFEGRVWRPYDQGAVQVSQSDNLQQSASVEGCKASNWLKDEEFDSSVSDLCCSVRG